MAKKILVVDDETDTRSLVRSVLEVEGFDISEAEDGKSGLKELKNKKFDLVLLDIMMPGMQPKEIIEKIKKDKENSNIKITYFSVVEFPEKEKQALLKEKNIVGYIQKPFTNEDLVKQVKKMVK